MVNIAYEELIDKIFQDEDITEEDIKRAQESGDFNINKKVSIGENTLCMYAADRGQTKTVRLLKKYGADVNAKDYNGETACMKAASHGHTETVRVLVEELKADVNAKDDKGKTACIHAATSGHTETVRVLVKELKADVNIKDKSGRNAFMWAVWCGQTETAKVLVKELKVDINATDNDGRTACMLATGHIETLFELVKLGADLTIEDRYGNTVFDHIDYIISEKIDKEDVKKKVIELRKKYEKSHPDKPKMADDLAARYLIPQEKIAVKRVGKSKQGKEAQRRADGEKARPSMS